MRNKNEDSHDMMGALERLDAALDAISCLLNLRGEWKQWEGVMIWKKDKA